MSFPKDATAAPLLSGWRDAVVRTSSYQRLQERLGSGERVRLSALPGSLGALLTATLMDGASRHGLLAILPTADEAEELVQDLAALLGEEHVSYLPEWLYTPYEELAPESEISADRYAALLRVARLTEEGGTVVMTASSLALPSPAGRELPGRMLHVAEGDEPGLAGIVRWLLDAGYERSDLVQTPAAFAVRGGIVDLAPPDRPLGIRIEFWGDQVESLREFRRSDQKTVGGISSVRVPPVREVPCDEAALLRALDRAGRALPDGILAGTPLGAAIESETYREGLEWYLPLLAEQAVHMGALVPAGVPVVISEPERCREILSEIRMQAEDAWERLEDRGGWLPPDRIFAAPNIVDDLRAAHPGLDMAVIQEGERAGLRIDARPTPPVAGDFDRLREEVARIHADGTVTTLLVEEEGQRNRLQDLLGEEESAGRLRIVNGQLAGGFIWPEAGLAVWPDHEVFRRPRRGRIRYAGHGEVIRSWRSLAPGDLVVHVDHGIGRFRGLRSLELDGVHTELLELLYASGDKLLVPIDQMDRVQRYVGADSDTPPSLNALGSPAWERTKERARQDLLEIAGDLARIYAAREASTGTVHPPDDLLMEELEASFPYTETPDQARAVEEVKRDLESPRPMDRLVCGDVGYGKTEVAIRAGLKVVEGGHQAAVLVPTTLLAQQHLETFRERLAKFPVRVEVLSRFRTPRQQKRALEGLASGEVDIVIGTHRLLSPDVLFQNLGLIVVDEEHRFGVKAKEELRRLRTKVDVLSLTATPIPRTLNMSLMGLRDMSIIATPPQDRLPVHTEVVRFDETLVRQAVEQELDRGGQVFFVHNRVQSIGSARRLLERLVPAARVAVAHGQMGERELESVMLDFASGEVDVLVATMIIESGLDIPNANTLIVNRADRFGLAQLYQLRGRVGRSSQKAYSYFLVPQGRRVTRDARRRLQAVQEHADLGAGFHLALKDLEIRGSGNLLGAQQHGHIAAVGFDLYRQMLEEAVAEIQGNPEAVWSPPRIEVPGEAFLPPDYVPVAGLRVDFYRKAVEARSLKEVGGLHAELRDRFGPMPVPALALLDAAAIRIAGAELGLDSVVIKEDTLEGRFPMDRRMDRADWEALMGRIGSDVRFGGDAPLRFNVALTRSDPFEQLHEARNRLLTSEEARYLGSLIEEEIPGKTVSHA